MWKLSCGLLCKHEEVSEIMAGASATPPNYKACIVEEKWDLGKEGCKNGEDIREGVGVEVNLDVKNIPA